MLTIFRAWQCSASPARSTALAVLAGVFAWGCGPASEDDTGDRFGEGEQGLSGPARRPRSEAIRDVAAGRGLTNGALLAGIAQVETGLSHCWSEATWACQGPYSSFCGGPVIAGAFDGGCEAQQGGLGLFQFDGGTYAQTLARDGQGILDLHFNISHAVDFVTNIVRQEIAGVDTPEQALAWMNSMPIVAGEPQFEQWNAMLACRYNGRCGSASQAAQYRNATVAAVSEFGSAFWLVNSAPAPDSTRDAVVEIGDPTGDGKADIIAQYANGVLRAWAGTGDLSANGRLFGGSTAIVGSGWATSDVQRIVTGDFTGDGRTDIIGQYTDGSLRAWASTGDLFADGLLFGGSTALVGTGWDTATVARIVTGDFTGDGKTDIIAQYADGTLRAWESTGDLSADGRLFAGSTAIVGSGWATNDVQRIVTGDFTGDRLTDIIGQYADGTLRAWASTGDLFADGLLFGGSTALVGSGWETGTVARIVTGDFTGDFKTDIIAQYADGTLRAWASTGDLSADGRLFAGSTAIIGSGWATSDVQRILTGDLTGDGKTDIIAQYASGSLAAWASSGDLSADGRLFAGSTIVGSGWDTATVPRIR